MRSFISAVLFAGAASAHTIFQQIGINGVMQTRYDFMRLPTYDGPITDVTATEMACNGGPNPLVKISSNVATVAAGSQITLQWYVLVIATTQILQTLKTPHIYIIY